MGTRDPDAEHPRGVADTGTGLRSKSRRRTLSGELYVLDTAPSATVQPLSIELESAFGYRYLGRRYRAAFLMHVVD